MEFFKIQPAVPNIYQAGFVFRESFVIFIQGFINKGYILYSMTVMLCKTWTRI